MLPPQVIDMLLLAPLLKELEKARAEAEKKLEKKVKSTESKKLTDKDFQKWVEEQEKKVEDERKKDPEYAPGDPVALVGLRGSPENYRVKQMVTEPEKPSFSPKVHNGALARSFKKKVVTKDKVEVEIGLHFEIDGGALKQGKLKLLYGGVLGGGRF